jgi:methyl coenzyme M reductase beta subunit
MGTGMENTLNGGAMSGKVSSAQSRSVDIPIWNNNNENW